MTAGAPRSVAPAQDEGLVDRRFLLGAATLVVLGAVGGIRLAGQVTRAGEQRSKTSRPDGGTTSAP